MSRVLTFARQYPAYHSKAGEPTFFVEKILNKLGIDYSGKAYYEMLIELNRNNPKVNLSMLAIFQTYLFRNIESSKLHTIRSGHNVKVDDLRSPRVWIAKPYTETQIIFAPDIQVKKVWDFDIKWESNYEQFFINGTCVSDCTKEDWFNSGLIELIAKNDGLGIVDFLDWFKFPSNFSGQIVAWDEKIEY